MELGIYLVKGVEILPMSAGEDGVVYVRVSLNSPTYGDARFMTELDRAPVIGSWITVGWQ